MFMAPGTMPFGYKLTRDAEQQIARNWWLLLITGLLEVPLGVLALANPGATLVALSPSPASGPSRSASCAS